MKSIRQNCSFKRPNYFTTYTWKTWKYVPQGILLIIDNPYTWKTWKYVPQGILFIIDNPCISVLPFSKMEEIKLEPVGSMYN